MTEYLIIGGFVLVGIIILIVLFNFLFNRTRSKSDKNLELETLLLKIPKYTKQEKEEISKEYIQNQLGQVENLFTSLSGLKAQNKLFGRKRKDIFSLEIVVIGGEINFYIAVPKAYKDFLVQQLQAVYPKIYFEQVTGYNIFQTQANIKAGALNFTADYSLPIKIGVVRTH